jgi:hypothetical protein
MIGKTFKNPDMQERGEVREIAGKQAANEYSRAFRE